MSESSLPVSLWIDAHLRLLNAEGRSYYIIQRGAYGSGTVLLKINTLGRGCLLMQQQRDLDGKLGWLALFKGELAEERETDAYIARAVERDPDLWAIEIEDKGGANPFEGKIF
jgi:hypothetical protein